MQRGAKVRLIRDNVVIHEGTLSTLKRFKDEVREVQVGQECGMAFENYQDMRAGDVIECFRVEKVKRTLEITASPMRRRLCRIVMTRPKAPSQRQLRAGELIRHALADILLRGEVGDPELDRLDRRA